MIYSPETSKHIKRNFNRASEHYDRYAFIQREVAARLVQRTQYVKISPQRVCDLGTSKGYTANLVAESYPKASIIGVDIAEKMLQSSTPGPHLQLCCSDAHQLPFADGQFEFVISNLMVQWCDHQALFAEVQRVLKPGGLFLFSTLGPDSLIEIKQAWATVDAHAHAYDFTDLHDLGDALVKARLADPIMEMEKITLHYSSLKSLLQDIRGIGARHQHPDGPQHLMGKQRWQDFQTAFVEQHKIDDQLPLSYEVIFGHAWKPDNVDGVGADAEGVAHFPLEYLRRRP